MVSSLNTTTNFGADHFNCSAIHVNARVRPATLRERAVRDDAPAAGAGAAGRGEGGVREDPAPVTGARRRAYLKGG